MSIGVSAIIPAYNRARFVERAVRSALAAASGDDEVIVVDDGSTDDTEKILRPYQCRIRYIRTENRGAGAARNRGVQEARKPLVAFLDSDDEWLPWRLDIVRGVFETRPDVLFTFTDLRSDHNGVVLRNTIRSWRDCSKSWEQSVGPAVPYSSLAAVPQGWDDFSCFAGDVYAELISTCLVCTITLTVRRIEAAGALRFAEDVPTYEDWWCYSQLARRGLGMYVDCETAVQHCLRIPRLTNADTLTCATTRLRMLEGIWGRDREFLDRHRGLYERVLFEQRARRVKGLIKTGQVAQARRELASLERIPALYRFLSACPGPLIAGLFELRQRLQHA